MTPTTLPTVLVVDDDTMILDLVSCYMDCIGYQAVTTTDGTEALHLARTHSPVLILSDLTMPGFNGIDVFKTICANPTTASVPFVLMSGDASPNFQDMAITAFLPKPFNMEALESLIQRLTQPRRLGMAA